MPYGFIVFFLDGRGYCFEYYAQYANSEYEAQQAFRFESLQRGYGKMQVEKVKPASRERWLMYEKHGDVWHSPNSRAFQNKRIRK